MGTERGYGGAEGGGEGDLESVVSMTVMLPNPVRLCVWLQCTCMHWSFLLIQPFTTFFCFLMISAVTNSCIQSTTCFKPDTVNKTVTREREGGRERWREGRWNEGREGGERNEGWMEGRKERREEGKEQRRKGGRGRERERESRPRSHITDTGHFYNRARHIFVLFYLVLTYSNQSTLLQA